MIEDARSVGSGELIATDICVVGAGIAGIALALQLAAAGRTVVLLEGGGARRSAFSDSLYRCKVEGVIDDYGFSRSRYLGGSSNCWTGWCQPISRADMAVRDWVPNSGWPIAYEEIVRYARGAANLLEVAPDMTLESCLENAPPGTAPLPLAPEIFRPTLSLISPPTRFGLIYRDALRRAETLRLLLHATATELVPASGPLADPRRIDHAVVRTPSGSVFRIQARQFVLAAGGIENPRLLLASKGHGPAGLGNAHDLVGRYFMDHARVRSGTLVLEDPDRFSRLYDGSYFRAHAEFGLSVTLAEAYAARQKLLPSQIGLRAVFRGEDTVRAVRIRDAFRLGPANAKARAAIAADPFRTAGSVFPNALAYGFRKASLRRLIRHFVMESVVEPEPDPENRVTLDDEHDDFGMPRAKVRWSVGVLERRSLNHAFVLLKDEVERRGLGRATLDLPEDHVILSTSHHMGSTRMDPDPTRGVVDTDGAVHGIPNLFVTGSSVFPTGLVGPPTMTICMLALRLADRLAATRA